MLRDSQLANIAPEKLVDTLSVQSVSNKTFYGSTLSSPTIQGGTLAINSGSPPLIQAIKEGVKIQNSSPGSYADCLYLPESGYYAIQYWTSNTTADFQMDIYSSPSFDQRLNVGEALTYVAIVKNGSTAYKPSSINFVSGGTYTVIWQNGAAPTAGSVNAHDIYTFNIVKTSTATFTVFASQTRFG